MLTNIGCLCKIKNISKIYFRIDLLCSFLYVTLNTTAGKFCPRNFFTRCTPSKNMTKKGNIILSSHLSCQYPNQFPAQSAKRTAGRRQYQKQLVELVPCPLVPPWGATGFKKNKNKKIVWVQILYPKATHWKRSQINLRKAAGSYLVSKEGCPKVQSCWDMWHGAWLMLESLSPSKFYVPVPYISCHFHSISSLTSGKFPSVLPEEVLSNSWVRFWRLGRMILYTTHCRNMLHWAMGLGARERKTPAAGVPRSPQNQMTEELFNLP